MFFLNTFLNSYFLSHFARVGDLFPEPPRGVENFRLMKSTLCKIFTSKKGATYMLVLPDKCATCKETSSSFGFCATWISFFNGSKIRRVNAYIKFFDGKEY